MTKNSFLDSILKIALPVTVQCMLKASFSIVDQVMIGQLGSESISGIGLGGKFASIHGVVLGAVTAAAAAHKLIAGVFHSGHYRKTCGYSVFFSKEKHINRFCHWYHSFRF